MRHGLSYSRLIPPQEYESWTKAMMSHFVISSAVRNLVPHQDVPLFSWYLVAVGKVLLWVLKDEISHGVYPEHQRRVRNDIEGAHVLNSKAAVLCGTASYQPICP